jgi:ribonuclease HI
MGNTLKHIEIYTDGACDPNPGGPGGYGVLLIFDGRQKEISGGFCSTTNNRMEIYAAIKGLEALKTACRVTLYSDSKYLVNAMTEGWAKRWKENNWWRNKQERAINIDLWEELLSLCEIHNVEFKWVKGHNGNPLNEKCDYLSVTALKQMDLPVDEGYKHRARGEDPKSKITHEGQACRKCQTPVVKRKPHRKPKGSQTYYFEYYLYCPKCHTMYMVDEAKRYFAGGTLLPWDSRG